MSARTLWSLLLSGSILAAWCVGGAALWYFGPQLVISGAAVSLILGTLIIHVIDEATDGRTHA